MGTLKLNVNLVDLFFTVKNKSGELVPHLTKDDCSVAEDKVPQTLKNFTAETHLPLTLGILLDTSGSQIDVLPLEQQVGSQFLERVLKSKDQAFLLSFDVNVDLLQDFTNSARMLSRAMNKAQINTAGGNGGSGIPGLGGGTIPMHGTPKGTLLYDADLPGLEREDESEENGRKAMIILTDGDDEGSDHKIPGSDCRGAEVEHHRLRHSDCRPGFLRRLWLATRLLGCEEDLRRDRRAPHQRWQQRQET